jgi:hypothetical protein
MMLIAPTGRGTGYEDPIAARPAVDPAQVPVMMDVHQELQTAVEKLQEEVTTVQEGQLEVQMDVNALFGRVESIETDLDAMNQRVVARFSDFDAEIQDIEDEVAAAKAAPEVDRVRAQSAQSGHDIEAEVALAVDAWRKAWVSDDLDTYIDGYDPSAKVTRINIINGGTIDKQTVAPSTLRERMARLMRQYDRTEVLVRGFRVVREGSRMVATFHQEFSAFAQPRDLKPIYADKGVKTLIFEEKGGRWVIVEENWVPLQR